MDDPSTAHTSVVGLGGSQIGDLTTGAVVGGDMTEINGADPDELLSFIRDYVFTADQRRETEHKTMSARMTQIENRQTDNLAIVTDAVRAIRASISTIERDHAQMRAALVVAAILAAVTIVVLCAAIAGSLRSAAGAAVIASAYYYDDEVMR